MVGDWLGDARENDVFEHAGARDVIRRDDFAKTGATTMRDVLNRIPGVNAPGNNGTGSHDLAMNFGIRGLNPRLASRSTVLMDGIPVPFAPYGQPQLSLAPVLLGNMDTIDVVRGGGAVRYGPQSVGGVVNFVTRAIPQDFGIAGGVEGQLSPTSSQNNPKETHNLWWAARRITVSVRPALLRYPWQRLARTQRDAYRRCDAEKQIFAQSGAYL